MKQYEKKYDANGRPYLETSAPGLLLTRLPLLNKVTSFTMEERKEFGLMGVLPTHVSTLEEQVERSLRELQELPHGPGEARLPARAAGPQRGPLLRAARRHLEEMLPIIYTPTVARR